MADAKFILDTDVDDVPIDAATTDPISSNWAYDHKIQMIDGPLSPGLLTGGIISEGTVGTITVTALTALLRTGTDVNSPLIYVTLAEQANQSLTAADTTYHVGIAYDSGNPTTPTFSIQAGNFNRTTEIGIGKCMKDTSDPVEVHFQNGGMRHADGISKLQRRATSLRSTELASGCAIGDVGGASRQFTVEKGVVYHGIHRLTPFADSPYNPFNSNDDKFTYVYGDTSNGFTFSDGTDTAINNTQYYDGAGALATVTPSRYACHWVYIHPDDNHVYVMYGETNGKLAVAEQAQPTSDLPQVLDDFGLLLGCIIIGRDATAFATIQMVTDTVFTGTAVADHAQLAGLTEDDHTQYIKDSEFTQDSSMLVGTGNETFAEETGAILRTSIGSPSTAEASVTAMVWAIVLGG